MHARAGILVVAAALVLAAAQPASASGADARLAVSAHHPLRLRLAVPPGYVERATLVLRIAQSTPQGIVVDALRNGRHRVASRRGPLHRGNVLRLDVSRALSSDETMVLSLRSRGSTALRAHPRLQTDSGPALPELPLPEVPAGEPEPPPPDAPAPPPPPQPAPDPGPVTPPSPPIPDAAQKAVIALLGDVTTSDGHRYAAVDDRALSLDGLKIIESSPGAYVGIYHSIDQGMFRVKVATSRDLLNWHWRADLDTSAAQAAIARAGDGSYVVAYEKSVGGDVRLRFRQYHSLDSLLAGDYAREFTAPHLLAPTAEGTPSIETISPDASTIEVGFHYYRDASVDRQARGTLTNFASWTAAAAPDRDALFAPYAVNGNIGDRDWFELDGHAYGVQEAQTVKDDWASWRTYLVDREAGEAFPLDPKTAGGSRAFGNPTATLVVSPRGLPAIVVTQFVFSEKAAPGEAGSLIYYKEWQPSPTT